MARSADKILSMQWRHSDPTRAISYKGGGVRILANFSNRGKWSSPGLTTCARWRVFASPSAISNLSSGNWRTFTSSPGDSLRKPVPCRPLKLHPVFLLRYQLLLSGKYRT
jgi:hypothetical protein